MARSRKKDKVKPHQKETEKAAVETPHPLHPEMETEVGEETEGGGANDTRYKIGGPREPPATEHKQE